VNSPHHRTKRRTRHLALLSPMILACAAEAGPAPHAANPPREQPAAVAGRGLSLTRPPAVVVLAARPNPVAKLAAGELVEHVRLATGLTLQTFTEDDALPAGVRVFVGETAAARQAGLAAEALEPDACILRVVDGNLYLLGRENDQKYKPNSARNGTLYGVYELLERYLRVRWLWPGKLGTYVPRTDRLVVPADLNEVIAPAFEFRRARIWHLYWQVKRPNPALTRIGFSQAAAKSYLEELRTYKRRYRLGDTKPKPVVGHHFKGWWQRHGKKHPEWFMLNAQGQRGPLPGGSKRNKEHVAVCVSNPDLHRYILEKDWDGGDNLSLGEVDARFFCQCERCRAWDGPQPDAPPGFARPDYTPRCVSDRYAKFWKTIYDQAVRRNPNVRVTTFLYWNYLPAPLVHTQLHKQIYAEFVPWTGSYVYFPMPEERLQWVKAQWLGWHEAGVTLAYRPNHLHGGYVFPNFSTWQYGDFFRFAYRNGMIGFDFDALFGHWAVKGPMLYVHMRLFVNPTLDVETIRRDYFAAFGLAAPGIEAYFDYWEKRSGVRGGNPLDSVGAFPDHTFAKAETLLDKAGEALGAKPEGEFAERVAFVRVGLRHARLAANFLRLTDRGKLPDLPPGALGDDGLPGAGADAELPADVRRFRRIQAALKELVAFRRRHEHLFFADLVDAAKRERRFVKMDRLLEDLPLE